MDMKCVVADPVMEDQSSFASNKTPKVRLIDLLDEVEKHVDLLRKDLLILEERKDTLLTTLDTIRHSDLITQLSDDETTEVELYADRLTKMCAAMDIQVITSRDQRQEEALYQTVTNCHLTEDRELSALIRERAIAFLALYVRVARHAIVLLGTLKVNRLIDSLVVVFRSDPQSARMRCLSYVNACSSRQGCKAIEVREGEEAVEDPSPSYLPDSLFEDAMFLCTPDDRKRIQRRLNGLLAYIERETSAVCPPPL